MQPMGYLLANKLSRCYQWKEGKAIPRDLHNKYNSPIYVTKHWQHVRQPPGKPGKHAIDKLCIFPFVIVFFSIRLFLLQRSLYCTTLLSLLDPCSLWLWPPLQHCLLLWYPTMQVYGSNCNSSENVPSCWNIAASKIYLLSSSKLWISSILPFFSRSLFKKAPK